MIRGVFKVVCLFSVFAACSFFSFNVGHQLGEVTLTEKIREAGQCASANYCEVKVVIDEGTSVNVTANETVVLTYSW